MDLALNQNHLNCYETVLDTTVLHEETMEMIVPDACPDILRIVDTCGTVCLKSKEAQEGRVEVAGTARCAVLYLPDGEEGMRRMEVNIPFFCNIDAKGSVPGCSVVVLPRILAADTRSLNPRKVLVRINLCIAIRAFSPTDTVFCTGAGEEPGIEQLCESHNAYLVTCVQEKPFTFSDDIMISASRPEAEELLKSTAELVCSESKIIGNKLIFKGEAQLRLLYRAADGTLCTTDHQLPFSQIMEVSGVEEEADCSLDILLTDLTCSLSPGDGRMVSTSMGLLAQAVVRQEQSLELLGDLYSVSSELSVEMQSYSLQHLVEHSVRRQNVREMVETGVLAKAVVDAYVSVGDVAQAKDGERMALSADVVLTVVYLAEDNQIYAVSRQVAAPCQADVPEGSSCFCACKRSGEVYATPTTGGIEVRFDVDFEYMALSAQRVSGVCAVQVSEAGAECSAHQPSIVLRAVADERLWDIAKAYRTTMDDILRANELESGDSLDGKILLIPKRR